MAHSLTITENTSSNVYRWAPSCSCGWAGVNRRRKSGAARQYREHVSGYSLAIASVRRGTRPSRRVPTPWDLLPEALR